MDILIAIILLVIVAILAFISVVAIGIEKRISEAITPKEEPAKDSKVTDPFTKPKPVHSSTSHIIVPKTPTEIRNQNFKKIQEGIEYGDIKKED